MNPALLYGRNHTLLGRIAAVSEGPCAIAISRGGARKTYHYKHANEDAAAFAIGPGGCVVAVADAHGGCEASQIAVDAIVHDAAPEWTAPDAGPTPADWATRARAAITHVHAEILQAVARGAVQTSRTTLAFALVRPADDLLAVGAIGDSHAFVIGGDGIADLAHDPDVTPAFLGGPADTAESLHDHCVVTPRALASTRVLMLVTDGLSERGIGLESPEAAIADAVGRAAQEPPDLQPLAAARGAIEHALEAQVQNRSGDNVASATIWLGG